MKFSYTLESTRRRDAMPSGIVVGVDGSEGASKALEWAIAEARLRTAPLRIVSAWHVPMGAYGAPGFAPAVSPPLRQSISAEAERVAEGAVRRAKDAGLEQVEHLVREGQAAGILTEAATDADLLIVGTRGHGGFADLLLGSVSSQCAHHAACPVVIVR
jgi:nucleotide-binding universal stress UspA family protein